MQEINSYNDVIQFLKIHPELRTIYDVKQNYMYVYKRFYRLKEKGIISKETKFPLEKKKADLTNKACWGDSFKTAEEFQKHIDEKGYRNSTEFKKNEPKLFDKLTHEKLNTKVHYPESIPVYNTKFYDTIEKCQKFIDDNGVEKYDDLRTSEDPEYHSVALSIKNHKWHDEIKWKNWNGGKINHKSIKSIEDVQKIIDEDDRINCPKDFEKYNLPVYKLAVYRGYCKDLVYNVRHKHYDEDTTIYTSVEDIQLKVVDKLGVYSIDDLKTYHRNAYNQYQSFRKTEKKNLVFKYVKGASKGEVRFMRELDSRGIAYMNQFTFEGFIKTKSRYRYDLFLPDYGEKGIIIEIHGYPHFYDKKQASTKRFKEHFLKNGDIHENDEVKYIYATNEKGIPVYYFTYDKPSYRKFGYQRKVYTDIFELFDIIGIIPTVISNFTDNQYVVECIQNFVNKFKIKNYSSLKVLNSQYAYRLKMLGLRDKIIYYKEEEQDLQE